MQTIRTTISLPETLHTFLVSEAEQEGKTLSELVTNKIMAKEVKKRKKALAEFRNLGKKINLKGVDYKELVEYGRKY